MRYARLRKTTDNYIQTKQKFSHPLSLIRKAYNIVFWVFLLPFFTMLDYSTGFIIFTIIIFVRLMSNLITNNVLNLSLEQYDSYPFRMTE